MTASNITDLSLADITGDTSITYSDKATTLAVIKAGGIPLYVPTTQLLTSDDLQVYLEMADGLVLPGANSHVNPATYNESATDTAGGRIDNQRDKIDIQLIRLAYKRKMPLIGICKGMQIMNVALGGTLHQKIPNRNNTPVSHSIPQRRTYVTHEATLSPKSFLKELFNGSKIGLNGGHQQAVNQLSDSLQASATAEDGIIEAYEGREYPFLLGIQFHAELLEHSDAHRIIFKRFVEAAATYKLNKREGQS